MKKLLVLLFISLSQILYSQNDTLTLKFSDNPKISPESIDSKIITTEMNYWPVETANLSELSEPFITMVKELMDQGAEVALRSILNGKTKNSPGLLYYQLRGILVG